MAEASSVPKKVTREGSPPSGPSLGSLLRSTEIDMRLLGMIGLLGLIWIGFNVMSGGLFLTPRNLFNLSVQSASTAIMATGMVLIIVSRNIDLSVGSMLGFIGYTMAMVQVEWIPKTLGLGLDQPYTWLVALVIGIALGALIGGIQGVIVAYGRVPAFIVTLGGLLVWRAVIFRYAQGQTLAPMDKNYQLLGGAPATGSMGDIASWILGAIVCAGVITNGADLAREAKTTLSKAFALSRGARLEVRRITETEEFPQWAWDGMRKAELFGITIGEQWRDPTAPLSPRRRP